MFTRALVLAALMGAPSAALGQVWNEIGDAGDMPATSQGAPELFGVVTDIFGACSSLTDADMYRITIYDPAIFSATTAIARGDMGDTTLYLFNTNGTGIVKNDDISSINFLSSLPVGASQYASLPAGDYLLAVGGFAFSPYWNAPVTDPGDLMFDVNNFTGVIGPQIPAPILGWTNVQAFNQGTYHISLTGAILTPLPVPAPAAAGLLALAGLAGARRRRA